MLLPILVVIACLYAAYYLGQKIYVRRWMEAFIDVNGIFPWPVLIPGFFFFFAALAKIWNPESDAGRRWLNAGLVVLAVVLILAWFLRAILWVAPDVIWPENENVGKAPVQKPQENKP